MTYHELVEKVSKALTAVDAAAVSEHIAVQVNVTGEAEGAFYIEVADGKLTVEPYDYVDRDAMLTASAEDLLAVAAGKLSLEAGIAEGKLAHEGSYEKVMLLNNVFAQLPVKKKRAAAKKTTKAAAEKETAAKPAAKRTRAKKTVETEEKAAETKPAKKTTKTAAKAVKEEKAETAAKKPAARKPRAKKTDKTEA